MSVCGLFSGIGGLEVPFVQRGLKLDLTCEIWGPAQTVLSKHVPHRELHADISSLSALPSQTKIVTAGFPCTDLSQAGRTAGISGSESGLVSHVFRIIEKANIDWLLLENVRNMISLDRGKAMYFLTQKLEEMGFSWAYRLVESRFTGIPQRRHRVLLVASRAHDPREVLFSEDTGRGEMLEARDADAYGFYWTEGLRGLGWAADAIPPLKGGSGLGIPSPPAVWIKNNEGGACIFVPSIEDAEALQGFPRGWTYLGDCSKQNRARWKLIGNAVTLPVGEWLASRVLNPQTVQVESKPVRSFDRWPDAAFGARGEIWEFKATQWPREMKRKRLLDMLTLAHATPLSLRAALGFRSRARRSSLKFSGDFLEALDRHILAMEMVRDRGTSNTGRYAA